MHNAQNYLRKCLDSLIAQTFKNFEIICVDDGSFDDSLNILHEYKNAFEKIKIFKQEKIGPAFARNFGLKQADGKYVIFLDSDDYFEVNLLEKLYKQAENFDAEISICSSRKVDNNENIIETNSPNFPIDIENTPLGKIFSAQDFKDNIFSLFTTVVWNKLILKSFLEKNEICFPKLNIYEDIAFVHSCIACAEKIIVLNEELVNYRVNQAISLASNRSKNTIEAVKSCLALKDFLCKKGIFNEFKNAYDKAFVNHIRAEISYCNQDEYCDFVEKFKTLLPDEWQKYQDIFKQKEITFEYFNQFIQNKKVMFWGASLFLKQILEKETKLHSNILGIIDKNPALTGKTFEGYQIYPPESILELKPELVILTVLSNNETIYKTLKEEFHQKYSNVKLLENILNRS